MFFLFLRFLNSAIQRGPNIHDPGSHAVTLIKARSKSFTSLVVELAAFVSGYKICLAHTFFLSDNRTSGFL